MSIDTDSLTVSLGGNTSIGTVYAMLYNADGIITGVKRYSASETVEVEFDDATKGSYVKIMWWYGNMYPINVSETISL